MALGKVNRIKRKGLSAKANSHPGRKASSIQVSGIPETEQQAARYANGLLSHIKRNGGQFIRDQYGSLHLIIQGSRIPLNHDRGNHQLAAVMISACQVSTLSIAAQAAIQRLLTHANREAGRLSLRRFSAVSEDGQRIYIPLMEGNLLQISAECIRTVPNGENDDCLWVEHPYGQPLKYSSPNCKEGLSLFERLLVHTQACRVSEMQWFVAINSGLFPFIREHCINRLIQTNIGPSQSGKTTGGERFTRLHGLGSVKGDFTVAALADSGDIGLLVMDNREQANFNQGLIDFCLFLSTGATRGRSSANGMLRTYENRPVGIITTIEGIYKPELKTRCVYVEYQASIPKIQRGQIESEIHRCRHEILSSLTPILQRYLQLRNEPIPLLNPIPDFEEHFVALCLLLKAYGQIAGQPEGWADQIIEVWARNVVDTEPEENDLEHPILTVFHNVDNKIGNNHGIDRHDLNYQGKQGWLYVTKASILLGSLQKLNQRELQLPKNPNGLTRRLRSSEFKEFKFLDTNTDSIPDLKRTANHKRIGFFIEDDGVTVNDESKIEIVTV